MLLRTSRAGGTDLVAAVELEDGDVSEVLFSDPLQYIHALQVWLRMYPRVRALKSP